MKTKHHRRPKVFGGTSDKSNISIVKDHMHKAYHKLFGPGNPHRIAFILNEYFIDPAYEIIVRKK